MYLSRKEDSGEEIPIESTQNIYGRDPIEGENILNLMNEIDSTIIYKREDR